MKCYLPHHMVQGEWQDDKLEKKIPLSRGKELYLNMDGKWKQFCPFSIALGSGDSDMEEPAEGSNGTDTFSSLLSSLL